VANPSKRKGTDAEVAVRDYLRANGWLHCERLALGGSLDRGDLTGIDPRLVVEVKACKAMDLGGWINEVDVEVVNAKADLGVVWHKRRGKANPSQWFVTMNGADFVQLLHAYTEMPFKRETA
jgi:hypothetical protein